MALTNKFIEVTRDDGASVYKIFKFTIKSQSKLVKDLGSKFAPLLAAIDFSNTDVTDFTDLVNVATTILTDKDLERLESELLFSDNIVFSRDGGGNFTKLRENNLDDAFDDYADVLSILFEVVKFNCSNFTSKLATAFSPFAKMLGGQNQTTD